MALAHKYRLPRRIDDFILEHHGTMVTRYQYNQALEKAGGDASKVDIDQFRYPGPRPRSRETAILMLADGSEARARAEGAESDDDLRAIVRSVIERVHKDNQLSDAPLTMRDLEPHHRFVRDNSARYLSSAYSISRCRAACHITGYSDLPIKEKKA